MYASTIAELFLKTTETFQDSNLLYQKIDSKWIGVTGSELYEKVKTLTLALKNFGACKGVNIGILSHNSPLWSQCEFAIACSGAASVGIFHSLVSHQIEYILNDSGLKLLFTERASLLKSLEPVWKNCDQVEKFVVLADDYKGDDPKVINLSEFMVLPESMVNHSVEDFKDCISIAKPEDLLTIFYTSGTVGAPKGVMISNQNLISDLQAVIEKVDINEKDRLISILPLSYALERVAGQYLPFCRGCSIYYSADSTRFQQEMIEVKPTILISVPYIIENLYKTMQHRIDSQFIINRLLFRASKAVGVKFITLKLTGNRIPLIDKIKYAIFKMLVYNRIKKTLGGKIKFIASGGAALSQGIAESFYSIGIPVLEGYGLTESGPILTFNTLEEIRFGTVGKALSHVKLKIAIDGEILVKTPSTMLSYYENQEDTRAVIDKKGWFHTGDIGSLDADGYLTITGRKKNILVTSSGKAIAPAPLEEALINSAFIQNAVVLGDDRKFVSAIIRPDFEKVIDYLKTIDVILSDPEAIIEHSEVTALLDAETGKIMSGFSEYERVKKYILITEPFPMDDGNLASSKRTLRQKLIEEYSELINELYKTQFDRDGDEI